MNIPTTIRNARIAVLMGGPSEEHAISLKSGAGVLAALREAGLNAFDLIIPDVPLVEEAHAFTEAQLRLQQPDLVFIALHGPFGEDGLVQALCESLGIAYTGSGVSASRLGMDKWASRECFVQAGLTVPDSICLSIDELTPGLQEDLPLPWVIKPLNQGSSIGIYKIERPEDIEACAARVAAYGDTVIVEAFIPGDEFTVGILGEQALPVIRIVPENPFFDFEAKYTVGKTRYEVPAPIDAGLAEQLQAWALRAHHAVGARHLSRTDFIVDADGQPHILEINTIPGFTPTSLVPKAAACIGLTYTDICLQLLAMAWSDHHAEVLQHG
jgi:D-alanine-D-alanine ligase